MITKISELEQKAINTMIKYHMQDTKPRKLSGYGYPIHPLAVHKVVMDMELSLKTRVATILHDMLDKTSYTAEQMGNDYGPEVLKIVQDLSENNNGVSNDEKKRDWKQTKVSTIEKMWKLPVETSLAAFADKYCNLVETNQFSSKVETFTKKFHCSALDMQEYFFKVLEVASFQRTHKELSSITRRVTLEYIHEFNGELQDFNTKFVSGVEML